MEYSRIRQLQNWSAEDKDGTLDLMDISEIEEAFNKIPDEQLRDLRENAMVDDMLDELESNATRMEKALYEYIKENYGESEAQDPSFAITPLAQHLNKEFNLS